MDNKVKISSVTSKWSDEVETRNGKSVMILTTEAPTPNQFKIWGFIEGLSGIKSWNFSGMYDEYVSDLDLVPIKKRYFVNIYKTVENGTSKYYTGNVYSNHESPAVQLTNVPQEAECIHVFEFED